MLLENCLSVSSDSSEDTPQTTMENLNSASSERSMQTIQSPPRSPSAKEMQFRRVKYLFKWMFLLQIICNSSKGVIINVGLASNMHFIISVAFLPFKIKFKNLMSKRGGEIPPAQSHAAPKKKFRFFSMQKESVLSKM